MIEAWKVVDVEREVHVVPVLPDDDASVHEMSDSCWCVPDVETYRRPLIIHRGFEN